MHNGRQIHVGRFDSVPDAVEAVRAVRLRLFTHNDADLPSEAM